MTWDPRDASWEERFQALAEFKRRFSHSTVPRDYLEDPELARWLLKQRSRKGQGTLSPERSERLEALGVVWEPYDAMWERRFQELSLATIRDRWTALVGRVGLEGLQLRDMRHEGANQDQRNRDHGFRHLAAARPYQHRDHVPLFPKQAAPHGPLAVDRLAQAWADAAQALALAAELERPTRQPGRADAIALTLGCAGAAVQGRTPRMTDDQTTKQLVREVEQWFGAAAWHTPVIAPMTGRGWRSRRRADEWLRVLTVAFQAELRRLVTPH